MLTRILYLSFLLCLSTGVFAQTTGVKRATISSSIGSSKYPQSIGQSSVVIGSSRVQSYYLLQGFLAPDFPIFSRSRETLELIRLQAYPNPFKDVLSVRFNQNTTLPTRLTLYDLDANIIWEQSYAENQSEIKLEKFQGIKAGKYILQVFQKGKPQSQSLIKEVQ